MPECPNCKSQSYSSYGTRSDRNRYKCKNCNRHFVWPRKRKIWSDEEERFLQDHYGSVSHKWLCKQLGITYKQFCGKRNTLGLGKQADGYDKVTMQGVAEILGISRGKVRYMHLPFERVCYGEGKVRCNSMISMDALTAWLKANQDKFKASKIERFALGTEPDWLRAKRHRELTNLN